MDREPHPTEFICACGGSCYLRGYAFRTDRGRIVRRELYVCRDCQRTHKSRSRLVTKRYPRKDIDDKAIVVQYRLPEEAPEA